MPTPADADLAQFGHDLREPLAAILLWARLLQSRKTNDEQLREGLEAIIASAESQDRMIRDWLSRPAVK